MQNNAERVHDYASDDLASGHTLLYGQYTIERHLTEGGFGMTYLARDSHDRRIVIKECFPSTFCRRVGSEVRPRKTSQNDRFQAVVRGFLREALRLAKFEHPNIVKIHLVFQENNTAYIAMDYVEGTDLMSVLEDDPDRLTDTLVEDLLRQTLNALDYVHKRGMLHRDISPDNILLTDDNKITLIDFGAAREDAAKKSRALSTVMAVKDGYSPHEFYYTDGVQRPSSDIYSIGATFYQLVTGCAPPDCQERVSALSSGNADPYRPLRDFKWGYEPKFLRAIDKALSIPQKERFQSANEWLDYIDNADAGDIEEPVTVAQPASDGPKSKIKPVDLSPDVVANITTLVEDTNSTLQRVEQDRAREETKLLEQQNDDEERCLVDIFGQPIEDVDRWLKEQDEHSRRKGKKQANEISGVAGDADGSGFGLLCILSRLSKKRKRPAGPPQN